uniref:Secreted protein n=1 Tax=Arundo donax TaxID=35708 RepID=A0A0A9DPJ3_ARUDO
MLLVTPRSVVILCLAVVGYAPCCSSLMSMLSCQCSGTPHGHSPTSAVGSLNQTLSRSNQHCQHCSALSTLRTRRS